ncbi:calcium-independent phospholipase [Fusarium sp. NRRL 25303]|nr:calcium-independent phospholipase [Fusarium sp. NRRL 25303]
MRSKQESEWIRLGCQGNVLTSTKTTCLEDNLAITCGKPSMVLLIGRGAKRQALGTLARPKPKGPWDQCVIHLRSEAGSRSLDSDDPVFLVDGPIPSMSVLPSGVEEDRWNRKDVSSVDAVTALYARALSPLVDVVCVFLHDFGSWNNLADFVTRWLHFHLPPTDTAIRPQLAIVVNIASWTDDFMRNKLTSEVRRKTGIRIRSCFHDIVFHNMAHSSQATRPQKLRDFLSAQRRETRALRQDRKLHFGKTYFGNLCQEAYKAFVRGQPDFDCIKALRASLPIAIDIEGGIESFLHNLPGIQLRKQFGLPVVASAMMLDAFPMGMHDFYPLDVFRHVYKPAWMNMCKRLRIRQSLAELIEHFITKQYASGRKETNVSRHKSLIESFSSHWQGFLIPDLCLMCLCKCRPAHYELPCGHAFCETDVRRFGQKLSAQRYHVQRCFLCCTHAGVTFKLKPATKGISILSIDGGGVRAVIPLTRMQLLQEHLRRYLGAFLIQDHFDLTVGTSSGSLYPSRNLDEPLIGLFGRDRALRGAPDQNMAETKVMVTVTERPRDGKPEGRVISNFGCGGKRKRPLGYEHACSGYFPPYQLEASKTTFFDGGMWRNNPTDVAMCEAKVLWPDIQEPDLTLSLGTGYQDDDPAEDYIDDMDDAHHQRDENDEKECPSIEKASGRSEGSLEDTPHKRRFSLVTLGFKGLSCFRDILASYFHSMVLDGHTFHRVVDNMSRTKQKPFYRLDTKIGGILPALNDVESMQNLIQLTRQQCGEEIKTIAESFMANLFYVELSSRPMKDADKFRARGRILCAFEPGERLCHYVQTLTDDGFAFQIMNKPVPISGRAMRDLNSRSFELSFTVVVESLDSPFSIFLLTPANKNRHVSASPFTLRQLLKKQDWDSMLHFDESKVLTCDGLV